MPKLLPLIGATMVTLILASCGGEEAPEQREPVRLAGTRVAVTDTVITDLFEAAGTARPIRAATLSTRLMATVTSVAVQEGDRVAQGELLLRLDARDLDAKRDQVEAGLAEANAMHGDASAHAARIRGLFTDSAATRSQLDQAEASLARAEAGVSRARAMATELAAMASYAEVRAPFAGVVTARLVDPGAFAAPGAPLVTVEDVAALRVSVQVAPDVVHGLVRGGKLTATIGDTTVNATIEGVVPSGSNRYTVNAIVANPHRAVLSGSAARLALPRGTRRAMVIPAEAIVRRDDLTGVHALVGGAPSLRWIRIGRAVGDGVEVIAGLTVGDTVVVPVGGN
jgi:RND family efflux transporter MFP subunit